MAENTPFYPLVFSTSTVRPTSIYSTFYHGYFAVDPSLSKAGASSDVSWRSSSDASQKLNIDLGSAKYIERIRLENFHYYGQTTDLIKGAKKVRAYGTNSSTAFTNVTYSTLTDLEYLGEFTARMHVAADISDPQYFDFNTAVAFRYYVFRIEDNYGDSTIGIRHIEIQGRTTDIGNFARFKIPVPVQVTGQASQDLEVVSIPEPLTSYLKSTAPWGASREVQYGFDPSLPTTGPANNTTFTSSSATKSAVRINIDTGNTYRPKALRILNYTDGDYYSSLGIKDVSIYGSNDRAAFDSTIYSDLTSLTHIADIEVQKLNEGPGVERLFETFLLNSVGVFQYYTLRISSNYGGNNTGFRHIELFGKIPNPEGFISWPVPQVSSEGAQGPTGHVKIGLQAVGYAGAALAISVPGFRVSSQSGYSGWTFTGPTNIADLRVLGNHYYFGLTTGYLRKYLKSGPLVWSQYIGDYSITNFYVTENAIYIINNKVFVKTNSFGQVQWTYSEHIAGINEVAVFEDFVYTASNDGTIHKVNSLGFRVWCFHGHECKVLSITTDDTGYVYSQDENGYVFKLSPEGQLLWHTKAF